MRLLIAALLLLVPLSAFAQTAQLVVTLDTGRSSVTVGPGDCDRLIRVQWTFNGTLPRLCEPLQSWLTPAAACTNRPGTNDVIVDTVGGMNLQQTTGTFTLRVDELPVFGPQEERLACPQPGQQITWKLCTSFRTSSFECTNDSLVFVENGSPPEITWDSRPPAAPTFANLTALDGEASVSMNVDGDTTSVRVEATADGASTRTVTLGARPFNGRLTNLQNGVDYTVTAVALDAAGNESPVSEAQTVRPVTTAGFWQKYKEAGGEEEGGCSHAGGGALVFLSALSLARLVWRKRS